MEQLKITKIYTWVFADDRWCHAVIPYGNEYQDMNSDYCGKCAVYCFDLETVTIKDRRVVNKLGFCANHLPKRYRAWFKIPIIPVPVRVAPEAGPSQAQLMRHGE